MHTVRIGFSEESCMEFHVAHVTSEMLTYMESKRKGLYN
jgi:hypothetical protein